MPIPEVTSKAMQINLCRQAVAVLTNLALGRSTPACKLSPAFELNLRMFSLLFENVQLNGQEEMNKLNKKAGKFAEDVREIMRERPVNIFVSEQCTPMLYAYVRKVLHCICNRYKLYRVLFTKNDPNKPAADILRFVLNDLLNHNERRYKAFIRKIKQCKEKGIKVYDVVTDEKYTITNISLSNNKKFANVLNDTIQLITEPALPSGKTAYDLVTKESGPEGSLQVFPLMSCCPWEFTQLEQHSTYFKVIQQVFQPVIDSKETASVMQTLEEELASYLKAGDKSVDALSLLERFYNRDNLSVKTFDDVKYDAVVDFNNVLHTMYSAEQMDLAKSKTNAFDLTIMQAMMIQTIMSAGGDPTVMLHALREYAEQNLEVSERNALKIKYPEIFLNPLKKTEEQEEIDKLIKLIGDLQQKMIDTVTHFRKKGAQQNWKNGFLNVKNNLTMQAKQEVEARNKELLLQNTGLRSKIATDRWQKAGAAVIQELQEAHAASINLAKSVEESMVARFRNQSMGAKAAQLAGGAAVVCLGIYALYQRHQIQEMQEIQDNSIDTHLAQWGTYFWTLFKSNFQDTSSPGSWDNGGRFRAETMLIQLRDARYGGPFPPGGLGAGLAKVRRKKLEEQRDSACDQNKESVECEEAEKALNQYNETQEGNKDVKVKMTEMIERQEGDVEKFGNLLDEFKKDMETRMRIESQKGAGTNTVAAAITYSEEGENGVKGKLQNLIQNKYEKFIQESRAALNERLNTEADTTLAALLMLPKKELLECLEDGRFNSAGFDTGANIANMVADKLGDLVHALFSQTNMAKAMNYDALVQDYYRAKVMQDRYKVDPNIGIYASPVFTNRPNVNAFQEFILNSFQDHFELNKRTGKEKDDLNLEIGVSVKKIMEIEFCLGFLLWHVKADGNEKIRHPTLVKWGNDSDLLTNIKAFITMYCRTGIGKPGAGPLGERYLRYIWLYLNMLDTGEYQRMSLMLHDPHPGAVSITKATQGPSVRGSTQEEPSMGSRVSTSAASPPFLKNRPRGSRVSTDSSRSSSSRISTGDLGVAL